jgi:hypothetical protein
MEDGDAEIDPVEGRIGPWYTYNDRTAGAMQTPPEGSTFPPEALSEVPQTDFGRSLFAMHTTGSGFETWGAGFGADLNNNQGNKGTYNASAFTGISFRMRAGPGHAVVDSASGTPRPVRVKALDAQTTPPTDGGECSAGEGQCSNAFGVVLTTLTNDWQSFSFTWDQFEQENWGLLFPEGVQTSKLLAIQFQVTAGVAFDIWVDDLVFTRAE